MTFSDAWWLSAECQLSSFHFEQTCSFCFFAKERQFQHIEVIQKIVSVNKETGSSVVMLHYPTFPDFKDLNVFRL